MLKAYKDQVVIEMETEDFVEEQGILIPTKDKLRQFMKEQNIRVIDENYNNHIRHGKVVSVGNQARRDEKGIKEDDVVIFNRHDGVEFKYDAKKYIAIPWRLILCLYRKPKSAVI